MYNPQYTRPSVLENKYLIQRRSMTETNDIKKETCDHSYTHDLCPMAQKVDVGHTINRNEVMDIYDTLMLCTYQIELTKLKMHTHHNENEKDEDEDEDEERNMKNMLYNVQLAQVFKLEDSTSVSSSNILSQIEQLYILIKDIDFIKNLISQNPYTYLFHDNSKEETEFLLFQTFFSYDFFHLFHKCLIYYFASTPSNDHLKDSILSLNTAMQNKTK